VTTGKIRDGGIRNVDLGADSVVGAKDRRWRRRLVQGRERVPHASDLATDSVNATEVANDSIDSGEIVDFGLSNQDVGVLFAEVDAAGVLSNSSGGVNCHQLGGLGNYDVDFGISIVNCTSVATIGPATTGSAAGEINVADRSGNNEGGLRRHRQQRRQRRRQAFPSGRGLLRH